MSCGTPNSGPGGQSPPEDAIFYELILLGRTQVKDLTHLRFLLLTCRSAVAGLEIIDGVADESGV